jgi:hypothetical protein
MVSSFYYKLYLHKLLKDFRIDLGWPDVSLVARHWQRGTRRTPPAIVRPNGVGGRVDHIT